jgi:hypothetical protein
MARLSDADVDQLVASLSGSPEAQASASAHAGSDVARPPFADTGLVTTRAAQRLLELSADGSLGPLLTQKLAAYLNRPLRCTSGDGPELTGDSARYLAQADGIRYWVRLESLLASAIADATIGGEGEAPKVGYGPKVARLAAGAVLEIVRVIAAALGLPEPVAAELDREWPETPPVLAGGRLSVAAQDYVWQAGLVSMERPAPQNLSRRSELTPPRPSVAAKGNDLEVALECVRRQLEEMAREAVTFGAIQRVAMAAPRVPQAWLRMSLRARAGGAIVLAVDRETAASLVNCALRADVVSANGSGALMQAGAEVILRDALQALAGELSDGLDEPYHILPLSDEAILATLPHQSVEHGFTCGARSGVLRWLVPDRLLSRRAGPPIGEIGG